MFDRRDAPTISRHRRSSIVVRFIIRACERGAPSDSITVAGSRINWFSLRRSYVARTGTTDRRVATSKPICRCIRLFYPNSAFSLIPSHARRRFEDTRCIVVIPAAHGRHCVSTPTHARFARKKKKRREKGKREKTRRARQSVFSCRAEPIGIIATVSSIDGREYLSMILRLIVIFI